MSEVQGKLVHNEWVCGDCYNCDGRDDKSHCIAVYNKEITQVAQKLDTTTKMHDRACNDIKEYSETIEKQAKEIRELTKALGIMASDRHYDPIRSAKWVASVIRRAREELAN